MDLLRPSVGDHVFGYIIDDDRNIFEVDGKVDSARNDGFTVTMLIPESTNLTGIAPNVILGESHCLPLCWGANREDAKKRLSEYLDDEEKKAHQTLEEAKRWRSLT